MIDVSGPVWIATLTDHKTKKHTGKPRIIGIGPKAQTVIGPLLTRDLDAYLFTPQESTTKGRHRATRPKYTTDVVRRAVTRACEAHDLPSWTPHAIRHTWATSISKSMGLEAASRAAGHASTRVTAAVYDHSTLATIQEVALKHG